MSIHEMFYAILEDTVCLRCGKCGMLPDGDLDWICPECEYEGTLQEDD